MNQLTDVLRYRFRGAAQQYITKVTVCITLIAVGGGVSSPLLAQQWVQTSAPTTNWARIVCSANGSNLVALAAGFDANPAPMFASEDAGITWHQTSAPITNWWDIACSADGEKIYAIADAYSGGDVFWSSTNGGANWIGEENPPIRSIASSADGTKLVAADDWYGIDTSADGGATWITNHLTVGLLVQNVVSSADGTKLAALVIDATSTVFWVFASTNSGATWDQLAGPDNTSNWGSLACSADGSLLVASISIIGIFLSTDWGQSWHQPNPILGGGVAISADGTKLFMTDGTNVYRSTDSGATWINTDAPTAGLGATACSADGTQLFAAAVRNGGIYVWQAVASSPQLSISLTQAGVQVSWPALASSILQQNSDLRSGNWTPAALTPILTNGQYQVVLPTTNGSTFYRLKAL